MIRDQWWFILCA